MNKNEWLMLELDFSTKKIKANIIIHIQHMKEINTEKVKELKEWIGTDELRQALREWNEEKMKSDKPYALFLMEMKGKWFNAIKGEIVKETGEYNLERIYEHANWLVWEYLCDKFFEEPDAYIVLYKSVYELVDEGKLTVEAGVSKS